MINIRKIAAMMLVFVMSVGIAFAADTYDVALQSVDSFYRTQTITKLKNFGVTASQAETIFDDLANRRISKYKIATSVTYSEGLVMQNSFKEVKATVGLYRINTSSQSTNTSSQSTNTSSQSTNTSSQTNGEQYNVVLLSVDSQRETWTINELMNCGFTDSEARSTFKSLNQGRINSEEIAKFVSYTDAVFIQNQFNAAGATTRLDKLSTTHDTSDPWYTAPVWNKTLYLVWLRSVNTRDKARTITNLKECCGLTASEAENTYKAASQGQNSQPIASNVTDETVSSLQTIFREVGAVLESRATKKTKSNNCVYLTRVNTQKKLETMAALRECGLSASQAFTAWNRISSGAGEVVIGQKVNSAGLTFYRRCLESVGASMRHDVK